jgi:hypothetical protein
VKLDPPILVSAGGIVVRPVDHAPLFAILVFAKKTDFVPDAGWNV